MGTYHNIKFNGKAIYQIKIQGKLNLAWSEMLGGMNIELVQVSEKRFISTLTGLIHDQAALSGILNTLYEMHFVVISVKCIGSHTDEKF